MPTITKFDKPTLRQMRGDLENHLNDFAKEWGINIEIGNASFMDNTVDWKLHLSIIAADGTVKTKEATALEHFYPQYVGKEITLSNGKKGTVVGYKPRSTKFPFMVACADGERYKVGERTLANQLGEQSIR